MFQGEPLFGGHPLAAAPVEDLAVVLVVLWADLAGDGAAVLEGDLLVPGVVPIQVDLGPVRRAVSCVLVDVDLVGPSPGDVLLLLVAEGLACVAKEDLVDGSAWGGVLLRDSARGDGARCDRCPVSVKSSNSSNPHIHLLSIIYDRQ